MGAYNKDQICKDFDTVAGGLAPSILDQMKNIAIEMLETLPDNQGRDLALSNLLYTAVFVKASLIQAAGDAKSGMEVR